MGPDRSVTPLMATFLLCLIVVNQSCEAFTALNHNHARPSRLQASTETEGIGVGIDLGTTNSAIAILQDDDVPAIISIPHNGRTMKSVVSFTESGEVLVGCEATEFEIASGKSGYHHVKRVIGTGSNFLPLDLGRVVPYLIWNKDTRSSSKGKPKKTKEPSLIKQLEDAAAHPAMLMSTMNREEKLSPEELSSHIVAKLLDVAREATGKSISRAVVGVPAYFNDAQRDATVKAVNLAGIAQVKLLREPEAAALAYGFNSETIEEELVLVFDLGGGTYDVSMLLVSQGLTEVICTAGDAELGGVNLDARISQYLSQQCRVSASICAPTMSRAAEAIRVYLSNNKVVNLALPLTEDGWNGLMKATSVIVPKNEPDFEAGNKNSTHVHLQLTRKQMETLCKEELWALLRPIREVAIMAGALLPGDTRPSLVESAIDMEETFREEEERMIEKEAAMDETDFALGMDSDELQKAKKAQQKGRKKARSITKKERKYREESRKIADSSAEVKVRDDGISGRPISKVVLVGGASRMPAISRLIASLTGVTPQKTVDPDEAVALGCAVHVGVLDGKEGMGTVLNPMQAAILRAMVEKQEGQGSDDDFMKDFI